MWQKEKTYGELEYENFLLKQELEELRKKHSDFVNQMANATTSVTNEWIKTLINGDLQLK